MTHKEREAYAQQLMAVLQGDAPAMLLTETGQVETPGYEWTIMPHELPPDLFALAMRLTSSDHRDKAEVRRLREQVLVQAPMIARPPRVNPLEYVWVLTEAEIRDQLDEIDWRGIQPEVHQWAVALLTLRLRAINRWWARGESEVDGRTLGLLARVWIATVWFDDPWPPVSQHQN